MRLLLLSNSRNVGGGFLEHAADAVAGLLGDAVDEVLFVPYAVVRIPHDELAASVGRWFEHLGVRLRSLHAEADPVAAVQEAQAIAVSGGNTFQLLREMHARGLIDPMRGRVRAGVPYVGWSAGSNVACPSVRTTNDMPIVELPSFDALGLVPFQINPHFTDATIPNHGGETRSERIEEFLALNPDATVVGLREGTWLSVEDDTVRLGGPHAARLFRAGRAPQEMAPGPLTI